VRSDSVQVDIETRRKSWDVVAVEIKESRVCPAKWLRKGKSEYGELVSKCSVKISEVTHSSGSAEHDEQVKFGGEGRGKGEREVFGCKISRGLPILFSSLSLATLSFGTLPSLCGLSRSASLPQLALSSSPPLQIARFGFPFERGNHPVNRCC